MSLSASRHGRADSGISIGGTPAVGAAAGAGAVTAGAVAAGVTAEFAAGNRPANGVPWGIKEARPVGNDDSRFCGAAAAAAGVFTGAVPGNAVGGCGRVTDAVAAGAAVAGAAAGAAACAPLSTDVRPCMSVVAAAGLVASCWRNGRPGTPGVGAGSAAAVALSPSASGIAPAAAIMLVASIFLVNFMVLPIR